MVDGAESPHTDQKPAGRIIAFVSANGGTGKTELSATAAYILQKVGKKVVTIDSDFSTPGLSLFLLGEILKSDDLEIQPEECLAEAVLGKVDIQQIRPRNVFRDNLEFNIILSNQSLWRGGVPDQMILEGATEKQNGMSGSSNGKCNIVGKSYFEILKLLCDQLKREFDYIIIDTRGGYDSTQGCSALLI